jgi:outer membrane lipoprotein LolB
MMRTRIAAGRLRARGGNTALARGGAAREFGCLALAALLSTACATIPEESDGLSAAQRLARVSSLGNWEMRGRIAIDTGEDAYQGRFSWWQEDEMMTLLVRGPFGAGSVQISGTPAALVVRTRDGSWLLQDAEYELSALLGWWVPVTSLKWWLFGLPDAEFEANSRRTDNDLLSSLVQRAWTLEYESYQLTNGLLVPRTIDMQHDTLRLVVTIDDWANLSPRAGRLN